MNLFEIANKSLPCKVLDKNNILWINSEGIWIGKPSIQNKDLSMNWINGNINKIIIKFK